MKVEQACKLSADGTAKTKGKMISAHGNLMIVNLYAKFNEVQGRYIVTQYLNRQKIETSKAFQNPHKFDQWQPSRRFSRNNHNGYLTKSNFSLYMLVSKENYRFNLGITNNIYSKVYQLRVEAGEFDLKSSAIVYGKQKHLISLEKMLHFTFEEYLIDDTTQVDQETQNWFDLDCFWYAKNEVRRINSFREDKIYKIFNGIDLNAFIIEDTKKLAQKIDL